MILNSWYKKGYFAETKNSGDNYVIACYVSDREFEILFDLEFLETFEKIFDDEVFLETKIT